MMNKWRYDTRILNFAVGDRLTLFLELPVLRRALKFPLNILRPRKPFISKVCRAVYVLEIQRLILLSDGCLFFAL
jgi:hypothetical protein